MKLPPTVVGGIRKLLNQTRRLEVNDPPTDVGGFQTLESKLLRGDLQNRGSAGQAVRSDSQREIACR